MDVRRISESEFSGFEAQWSQLLPRSNVDPLFMSWAWQHAWWSTWSQKLNMSLILLAAYDGDDLVGIAPLYTDYFRYKKLFKARRIQLIGANHLKGDTFKTEYLDFIADKTRAEAVCKAFVESLLSMRWDIFVASDSRPDSALATYIIPKLSEKSVRLRRTNESVSYQIMCNQRFDGYLASLGRNTRLRLFGRRKVLEKIAPIRLERTEILVSSDFDELDQFHLVRWGKHCFSQDQIQFLNRMLGSQNDSVWIYRKLFINDELKSILFNVIVDQTEYNIQSGFDQGFHKKIALGTLHTGYVTQALCSGDEVSTYDLLAGPGMNSNYKEHLANQSVLLHTYEMYRSSLFKFLVSCIDYVRNVSWKLPLRFSMK